MRMTRSSMLEVLGSEYVKLARLKGLPESLVIGKHAPQERADPGDHAGRHQPGRDDQCRRRRRDGVRLAGIGRLLYEGVTFRDFPVVQAVVVIGGSMIIVVNLLVDILYALIDPRIRLES
jgi:peptide/nickel transport system permease protein